MARRVIHQSLMRPNLFAGAPRKYAVANFAGTAILLNWSFQLGQYLMLALMLAVAFGMHALMVYITRRDSSVLDAYFRHIKYQKFYPGRSHPDAPSAKPKSYKVGAF